MRTSGASSDAAIGRRPPRRWCPRAARHVVPSRDRVLCPAQPSGTVAPSYRLLHRPRTPLGGISSVVMRRSARHARRHAHQPREDVTGPVSAGAAGSESGHGPRYAAVPAVVPLPTAPRLESWDASGSAFQAGLAAFLRELERLAAPLIATATGTKRYGPTSYFGIGQARSAGPGGQDTARRLRTTASAGTAAYKRQIADALRDARPVPPGPVALEIRFGVGAARSWINLWKPTIDALGALLGAGSPARPWPSCASPSWSSMRRK